jgi:hypothetical protein
VEIAGRRPVLLLSAGITLPVGIPVSLPAFAKPELANVRPRCATIREVLSQVVDN